MSDGLASSQIKGRKRTDWNMSTSSPMLHEACRKNQLSEVTRLIDKSEFTDLEARDDNGHTAL